MQRTCEQCQSGFQARPVRVAAGYGRFCSPACQHIYMRRNCPSHVCATCGVTFTDRDKNAKFCSMPCYDKARNVYPRTRHCEHCGAEFKTHNSAIGRGWGKFCSMCCYDNARMAAKQLCMYCGVEFTPHRKGRKFCSGHCVSLAQRKRIPLICPVCQQPFLDRPCKAKTVRYCSNVCYLQALSKRMQGSNSPTWNGGSSYEPYTAEFSPAFKRMIRICDNHRCAFCGKLGNHVHHIDYDKTHSTPDNCITLCINCHSRTNTKIKRAFWQALCLEILRLRGWGRGR